jgi:hypothetical protein
VLRAHDEAAARRLSGMSQLVGYGIGATGPLLAGGLYGATGGWVVPLATLAGLGLCWAAVAAVAGRPVTLGGPPAARADDRPGPPTWSGRARSGLVDLASEAGRPEPGGRGRR